MIMMTQRHRRINERSKRKRRKGSDFRLPVAEQRIKRKHMASSKPN